MIHRVDAPDDARLAPYARVGDHGWLLERGLFVAEGRLLVERLIDAGGYDLHSVLITAAALGPLAERLAPLAADVYVAPQTVLNAVTGFNFHRGCLALARRPDLPPFERFVTARRLLILEAVGNPDNVGGLFRAAGAFGAGGVLLDPRTADPLYRKAIRTSMGAALRVPYARVNEWPAGLHVLADRGFRIVALTPEPSAAALPALASAIHVETPVALMLGAEGAGLSREALAAAHDRVRIPISRDVDSLNVVVAAAIALYALGGW